MRSSISTLFVVALVLGLAFLAPPAGAQLVGNDTAPGESCAGFPEGAARVSASPVGDGSHITLICDGSLWQAAGGGGSADNLGDHTATQALDMGGFAINELADPSAAQDAATKAYVDGLTGANEIDPQVGAVTNNQWCRGDGSAVQCDQSAPGVTDQTTRSCSASAGSSCTTPNCPAGYVRSGCSSSKVNSSSAVPDGSAACRCSSSSTGSSATCYAYCVR